MQKTLPPPLTDEGEILGKHARFVSSMVDRFARRDRALNRDDLRQVALLAFLRTIRAYDVSRLSPLTGQPYSILSSAGLAMHRDLREFCLRYQNSNGMSRRGGGVRDKSPDRLPDTIGLDDILGGIDRPGSVVPRELAVEDEPRHELEEFGERLWRVAAEVLTHREYWVVWSVYSQDRSDAQIARWLGVSRVAVGQTRRKALDKLRPHLLEFADG